MIFNISVERWQTYMRTSRADLPDRPLPGEPRGGGQGQGRDHRLRRVRRRERARQPDVHRVAEQGRPHPVRAPLRVRRRGGPRGARPVRRGPPVRGRLPAGTGRRAGRVHRLRADRHEPPVVIRAAVPADEGRVAALAAALAQSFPFSPAAFAASYPALLAAPEACLLVADTAGTAGTGAALAGY